MQSKASKKTRLEPSTVVSLEQAAEVFPAVRYFQIHFEFLQEQLRILLHNQEVLQQQMQELDRRLSCSSQGIRVDSRSQNILERLKAGRASGVDNDIPALTPGRRR